MIHPNTVVHEDAKVGKNVVIEPFTTVHKNVEIGEGTWIGSNVTIFEGARIGKNCRIFPGSSIAAIPQDLKFNGEDTVAEIGDNTTIREYVTISRGTVDRFKTTIGSNCLLMAYVHVAHDCEIGNNCILVNAVQLAGHVQIDDFAIVGGASAIHQYVRIGSHVMISGGSLVRKDVPPYTKAAREPLTYCGINSIGLRRRGFKSDKINEIQDVYRYIFQKGLNYAKAVDLVELDLPATRERDEILKFIRNSDRGLMKGYFK